MEEKNVAKIIKNIFFAVVCICLNYGGKLLAEELSLPLWLDSFGTVAAAYVMGPVFGALVGVLGNVVHGFLNPVSYVYSITSIAIGVCVGIFAKRRFMRSFFWTASVSSLLAVISTVISTVLNMIFYGGATGNIWGDGVIGFLGEKNFPGVVSYFIGEFYIDFLDKTLTLTALYIVFFIIRKNRNNRSGNKDNEKQSSDKAAATTVVSLVAVFAILAVTICPAVSVFAENAPAAEEATATDADNSDTDETEATDSDKSSDGNVSNYRYTSYVQTIYNSSNSLPCGEANDIAQTEDGILWIGTYAGLYRCNGSDFQWTDEYESIKNVNCLYVDGENRLWIGTNDNGFSICEDEEITEVVDDTSGLPSNSVRSIVQCADGNYYVGTTDKMQVVSLDGGLVLLNQIDINYAGSLTADGSGFVAAVDTNGTLFLIKNQEILACRDLDAEQEQFTTCTFDKDGILYVGTSANHIITYDVSAGSLDKREKFDCGDLHDINSLYFPEEGGLFICADNGVGYMDDDLEYSAVNTGQFNNSIDNMTIDYQGNYWFTSSRLGVLKLCESDVVDYYGAIGVDSKVVNTSEFWNGLLYVGTDNGLDILDTEKGEQIFDDLTDKLSGTRIRCINTDSKNHLWVCTYGSGLWEIDGDEITVYSTENGTFGDRARVVIEMSNGVIAAAGDNGLSLIDDGEIMKTFKYGDGLSNAMILSLMEMSDGGLMAGTDGDGIAIIKDGEVVRKLTREDGLSSGVILRTVADEDGDGAFVVTSNGLCYVNADYSVQTLSNFPYFNNYDIWPSSEGKLFVLGSAGIYIVDRDELLSGGEVEYEVLDAKTGLTSSLTANSWNTCIDGEYLYLSCDSGVYGVDMKDLTKSDRCYRMMISSVLLDDVSSSIKPDETLRIDRDVNKIELDPEIINYSPEDPYVMYYLEGFDRKRNIVSLSELGNIVYTNLPVGSYTLHLAVLGNDKETVLVESSYEIVKEKAIYDNTWFQVYMILVLAIFVSWFTWFIFRTQVQRTLNLQKKEIELAQSQIKMGNETILAIARTVDAKDENTSQHSQRVSEYSVLIAKELGLSADECETLRKTALLHDIGKIGIADRVLNKPGKLTDEEYELMKSHVTKGAEILKDFTLIDNVWEGALYHHERYDGRGYVHGLKGEEIPRNARIIGIADAFDAMTANRVYRKKQNFEYVLSELKKGRGTQFDPQYVDILLKLIEEGKIDIGALYSEEQTA
jgi:energy-coupling factor transport system substrate-specific component